MLGPFGRLVFVVKSGQKGHSSSGNCVRSNHNCTDRSRIPDSRLKRRRRKHHDFAGTGFIHGKLRLVLGPSRLALHSWSGPAKHHTIFNRNKLGRCSFSNASFPNHKERTTKWKPIISFLFLLNLVRSFICDKREVHNRDKGKDRERDLWRVSENVIFSDFYLMEDFLYGWFILIFEFRINGNKHSIYDS